MGREISISFALNAALGSGFRAVFQSAATSARNVASAIRDMEKTPVGQLGASMARQREKIKGLAGSLKEARATLATLQSQAQASGTSTKLLATQIRQAEDRVNNLNGALSRQRGLLLNTAAQAATSGKSVRQLGQEYDNLTQQIERARRVQSAMAANRAQGDALRAQRADLNSRLAGAMATAATVGAPVALSIGFEDQMAKVGAVSRASKEDLALLTDQARQLGRDTSFSASQAAEGMQYLAMAGFKTSQVMAAMPEMLDLAAASGTDLGTTADIASNILSAFELKAEAMGHVGDVLTVAFTSSNTTLESLGETMKYVGPVAKDAGASIEDAVAMAAMLGNVGISGSMAGTASKSIFARLAAPPTEAAKALNALNIKTKDAQGNLRAVPDLLEEITLKTASMGTADRTDVFSKVFGLEPMAGASALAKQAAQTVDENGQRIVDSMGRPTTALLKFADDLKHASDDIDGKGGAAARVAKQMNATTGGHLRMLKSAWEDAGISVGNLFLPAIQAAAGALSTIANVISGAVQRFPNLSKGVALAVGGFLALTAASVGIGLVLNIVRTSLNGFRGVLLRLSASQVAATGSTGSLSGASGVFGAIAKFAANAAKSLANNVRSIASSSAFAAIKTGIMSAATSAFGVASRIAGAGARFFAGGLRSILAATGVGALLVGLGFAINLLIDNWDAVVAAMSAAWGWVTDTWSRLGVFFSELGKNLGAVFSGWGQTITGWVEPAWNRITGVWSDITGFFASLFDGVANIAATVGGGIASFISRPVETISTVWNGITGFFSGLWQGIISGASGIGQGILSVFSGAKNAVIASWNGISSYYSWLFGGIINIAGTIWNGIVTVIGSPVETIKSVWNTITSFFSGLWNKASSTASGFGSGLIGFFQSAWQGIVSVWNGITGFFSGLWQGIISGASGIAQGILSVFSGAKNGIVAIWNGITGIFSNFASIIIGKFIGVYDFIVGVWSGISSFFSSLWDTISANATGLWNGICSIAAWAFDTVTGVWNGAMEFFTAITNNISAAFAWAQAGIIGIWQGVAEFFGSVGQGISDCFSGVWQGIVGLAAWAWEGIAGIWTGVSEFFGGIVDSIFGVFTGLFDWLKEKFEWVFSAIDAVGSVIGSITGAVKGAWNAAFGDKKESSSPAQAANGKKATTATSGDKATTTAQKAAAPYVPRIPPQLPKQNTAASAAQNASANPLIVPEPKYQPVSADAYHEAFDKKNGGSKSKNGSGSGNKASGGGGGKSRSGSGAAAGTGNGANSGPVTVVTLDSGNQIRTQFFPAASNNAAANANTAVPLGAQRPYGTGVPLAGKAAASAANPPAQGVAVTPARLTVAQESPDQTDKGFVANAMSALKSSGIGGVIGQGLQAGIGMAKSVFGIGQNPQDSAVAQAARTPTVQTQFSPQHQRGRPLLAL